MKTTSLTLALLLTAVLAAFAGGSSDQETAGQPAAADSQLTIGISKIVTHPALDALEQGIMETVGAAYPDVVFDNQNAAGEVSTAATIAQKFKTDQVDLAVGIATPTAVALANALDGIPVVFSAVTDPVDAGLVPSLEQSAANITGVSDMTPVEDQIKLLTSITPVSSLGHVYSSGEANAVRLAELTEEACKNLGIEFVPATVSNSAEVKQAAQAIAGRVDAFYVSTDNTVVSAIAALSDAAMAAGVPVMSADPTSAPDGEVLMAWGFDYYKMGLATGRLISEILGGANPADIPTRFMTSVDDVELFVNLQAASELGISIPDDLVATAATVVR